MIGRLAWRNIWRQPIRTGLSVAGMAFASALLVFMLSFQFGGYDTLKSSMLKVTDGYGQFQPPGYRDDPDIARVIEDPDALLADLARAPAVGAAAPRGMAFVLLARGERSFAAALAGIDPAREAEVTTLPRLIARGRALAPGDDDALVIGEGLARNLGLAPGDRVTLLGTAMDGSVAADVLTLVGIARTGVPEVDRQVALMPLRRFQDTFYMDGAVNVVAVGGDFSAIDRARDRLAEIARRHGLRYLDWGTLRPEVRSAIQLDISVAMTLYATLVFVVVFVILNTLYMSVLERTREFGMLLAIGMKPGQIGRLVWAEMFLLSLLGTGLGVVLGMAVTAWVGRTGISFEGLDRIFSQWGLPPRIHPRMTPFRVLFGPGAIVAAIVALGVIPYRRVRRLRPVEAMGAP